MATVQRKSSKQESLTLAACPCCGGDVSVGDCGYSSFNPGWAQCSGCKRKWRFESVDDEWDAGKRWNKLAAVIQRRLEAFALLRVGRSHSEVLKREARALLSKLESTIVGSEE